MLGYWLYPLYIILRMSSYISTNICLQCFSVKHGCLETDCWGWESTLETGLGPAQKKDRLGILIGVLALWSWQNSHAGVPQQIYTDTDIDSIAWQEELKGQFLAQYWVNVTGTKASPPHDPMGWHTKPSLLRLSQEEVHSPSKPSKLRLVQPVWRYQPVPRTEVD